MLVLIVSHAEPTVRYWHKQLVGQRESQGQVIAINSRDVMAVDRVRGWSIDLVLWNGDAPNNGVQHYSTHEYEIIRQLKATLKANQPKVWLDV